MKKILLIIFIVIAGFLFWFYFNNKSLIFVSEPKPNQIIYSPLLVRGKARGTWYFEASFPVKLLDGNKNELVVKPAQAQGEWMTENFAPFEVLLEFSTPTTKTGTLILQKDNPSGLPEYDDEIHIPIRFDN